MECRNRRGGLFRDLLQLGSCVQLLQFRQRKLREQHAPHRGGVGRKAGADSHIARQVLTSGDAQQVHHLLPVQHAQMHRASGLLVEGRQEGTHDFQQLLRSEVLEPQVQHPVAQLVGLALRVAFEVLELLQCVC